VCQFEANDSIDLFLDNIVCCFFVVLERVGKLVCVIKFVRWVLWQFEGIECIDLWSGLFGTRWDGYLFVGCCGSCKVTTLLRYRNVLERVGKQVCVI